MVFIRKQIIDTVKFPTRESVILGKLKEIKGLRLRHTQCMPYKKSRRLTPRSLKRAIS